MKLTPSGKFNETHLDTAETFDVIVWNSQETKKLPNAVFGHCIVKVNSYYQSEDKLRMIDLYRKRTSIILKVTIWQQDLSLTLEEQC